MARSHRIPIAPVPGIDALAIEVAVPGERWEIEFLEGGDIEIEIFRSNGEVHGPDTLDELFRRFGD